MVKIRFEIGHIKNTDGETESVYQSDILTDCLKEWLRKDYDTDRYFIDVWEFKNDIPYPIADVKIEDWIFNGIKGEVI